MNQLQALSPLESAFLYVEGPRTPMHIGTVGIFEGAPLRDGTGSLRMEEIRQRIGRRLALVPKLRQRVHTAVLPGAPPTWVDDPSFDLSRHVESASLGGPGGDAGFRGLCGELFAQRLDRHRPLWHLCVVDGLEGGRVGIVERIHHAVADGLAGVEMATVLFDADAESDATAAPPWQPEAAPGPGSGALQDLGRLAGVGGRWAGRGVRAARHPLETLRGALELGGAVATLGTTGVLRTATSLNRPITGERSIDVVRCPLGELQESARALGVTVNDLVLTAVGAGVARLLQQRGETGPGDVQALVPVGLDPGDRPELGNRVSAWFVRVPVGTGAPLVRLQSVTAATRRARSRHEELAAEAALDLLTPVPQPVVGCLSRLANHQPLFNLIVTNVPGPPTPLFLLGARLLEAYPFVPLAGNLTMGLAVLSYDGSLALGVLADPATCPDAAVFAHGVEADLDALVVAAGGRVAPPSA